MLKPRAEYMHRQITTMQLKQRCRRMRKTLQLFLLSMAMLFFYLYSQWSLGFSVYSSQNPGKFITTRNVLKSEGNLMISDDNFMTEGQEKGEQSELERIIVRKTLTKSSYPLTLTTPYRIENPDICTGHNVTLVFLVHTAVAYFNRRQAIRETFGNKNIFKAMNTRVVFLLGRPTENKTEQLIQVENSKYGDIVQGEFMDTYRNLTLKGVMGFRWITEHCSHAELIVKIDDDVFIDVFRIVEVYIPQLANKTKQIFCNTMYPSPVLREEGKWQVDEDYFRGVKYYPEYCSGFTVFMTPDAVRLMYRAAFITPFFWVDDVYLFGLLPARQNITMTVFTEFSLSLDNCYTSYNSSKPTTLVSCVITEERSRKMMWRQTLMKLSESTRRKVNDEALTQS